MTLASEWSEAARNWRPPSGLGASGPRDVSLSATGKVMAGFTVVMLIGALALFWFLSRQQAREAEKRSALEARGVETQAMVTRHWRTGGKDDTPMIAYTFEAGGQVYHGSSSAPRREWADLTVGTTLAVRYMPDRPEVNHPSAWAMKVMPSWVPVVMAAVTGSTGLLFVFLIRRDLRLLAEGRAAPARVTGYMRVKQGYSPKYEFRLPDGTTRKGRGGQMRVQPDVGDIVTVLYDPDNPRRNAPYPLQMARVNR